MRLSYQIAIPSILTILSLLGLSGFSIYSRYSHLQFLDESAARNNRANHLMSILFEDRSQEIRNLASYALNHHPDCLKRLSQLRASTEQVLEQLQPLLPKNTDDQAILNSYLSLLHSTFEAQTPLLQSIQNHRDRRMPLLFQQWLIKEGEARDALRDLRNTALNSQDQLLSMARNGVWKGIVVVGILVMISILTVTGSFIYFQSHVANPLKRLSMSLRKIGKGHFFKIEPIHSNDEIGALSRSFNIMVDQLERTNGKLTESNHRLKAFSAVAAHDLRSPISTIRDYGVLLADSESTRLSKEGLLFLQRLVKISDRSIKLIDSLLSLSRAADQPLHVEITPLNTVIDEVLASLQSQINEHRGLVQVRPLPVIQGDPVQLGELFQNLIGNALKYHKPEEVPVVQISAHTVELEKVPYVRVSVSDNGIGFEPAETEKLFIPFHRAVGDSYDGSGVGLAVCKEIVQRHNAHISAESKPGHGSVFHVDFPLELLAAAPHA
jgi:signal transduction histidine kinase